MKVYVVSSQDADQTDQPQIYLVDFSPTQGECEINSPRVDDKATRKRRHASENPSNTRVSVLRFREEKVLLKIVERRRARGGKQNVRPPPSDHPLVVY